MVKQTSWVNRFLGGLLRSPFHWLASGKIMLIVVRGRKTGMVYTTPVNYAQRGNTIYVISRLGRTWWKNVGSDTNVRLWLRGKECIGCGRLYTDPEKVTETMRLLYPTMKAEKIAQRAPSRVAIWIEASRA